MPVLTSTHRTMGETQTFVTLWWPVGIICIFMKKFCSSISLSPSLKSPKTLGFSLIMTVGSLFSPAVNPSLGVHLHAPGEWKQGTHTNLVGMELGSQQEWLREDKKWARHFQVVKVLWRDGRRAARWRMSLETRYNTAGVATEGSQGRWHLSWGWTWVKSPSRYSLGKHISGCQRAGRKTIH